MSFVIEKESECSTFEFEIPWSLSSRKHEAELFRIAQEMLDKKGEGWLTLKEDDSPIFFFSRDGKRFAKIKIMRWL